MIYVLDTNVVCRFFVGDNQPQFEQAKQWLKRAEQGDITIIIKPVVIAEACFVLESYYTISKETIAEKMLVFLSQRWLKVEDREHLLSMWDHYSNGSHFVDSFLLAWQRNKQISEGEEFQILTFDKQILKLQQK